MGKLIIIGLDGIGLSVLDRITSLGLMPKLTNQLGRNSVYGELTSTVPPYTPPSWTSIATGLTPGRHGILDFLSYSKDRQRHISGIPQGAFWDIASLAGKTVGIFNYPLAYPARPINGYFVSGMMTPSNGDGGFYPAQLKPLLSEYQVDLGYKITRAETIQIEQGSGRAEFLQQLITLSLSHINTSWKLLNAEPMDIAMHVFVATDRFLHYFWDFMESPTLVSEHLRIRCFEFWKMLDDAIAQIRSLCGPQDSLLIVSDHGFGRAPIARLNVNLWLTGMGYKQQMVPKSFVGNVYSFLAKRRHIRHLVKTIFPRKALLNIRINSLPQQITQFVSVQNVIFRPLHTTVLGCWIKPTAYKTPQEQEETIKRIRHKLESSATELKLPDGTPLITKISNQIQAWPSSQAYFAEGLPDLVVEVDERYGIVVGSFDERLLIPFESKERPGDHRSDGIIALAGQGISQPHRETASICRPWDVAGLALYLSELPIPRQWDAKVPTHIINTAFLETHPPQYEDLPGYTPPEVTSTASPEDLAFVEDRLRQLGYLDE